MRVYVVQRKFKRETLRLNFQTRRFPTGPVTSRTGVSLLRPARARVTEFTSGRGPTRAFSGAQPQLLDA